MKNKQVQRRYWVQPYPHGAEFSFWIIVLVPGATCGSVIARRRPIYIHLQQPGLQQDLLRALGYSNAGYRIAYRDGLNFQAWYVPPRTARSSWWRTAMARRGRRI